MKMVFKIIHRILDKFFMVLSIIVILGILAMVGYGLAKGNYGAWVSLGLGILMAIYFLTEKYK